MAFLTACGAVEQAEPSGTATQPTAVTTTVPVAAESVTTAAEGDSSRTAPVDQWAPLSIAPVQPGLGTTATWTGRELIVVGGTPSGELGEAGMTAAAAAYDPTTDRWRILPPVPGPGRAWHNAVWTGREVIVWGGRRPGGYGSDGAAYDPTTGRWRTIAPSPIAGAQYAMAAWTGREMVVWGGNRRWEPTGDGAAYDPATDRWRILPAAPIDDRSAAAVAWTGQEVLIWGGNGGSPDPAAPPGPDGTSSGDRNDGAGWDPRTGQWRQLASAPLRRRIAAGVWTGRELVVFGGSDDLVGGTVALDGAAYDLATDEWRTMAPPPAALTEGRPVAWTGREVLVAGRELGQQRWAAYEPGRDRWRVLPTPPAADTWEPTAEWTGAELLAWGAVYDCRGDCNQFVTGQAGFRYTPPL